MRLFVLLLMSVCVWSQLQAVIGGFGGGPEQAPEDQELFSALEQRLPLDFSQDMLNNFSLRVGAETVVSWGIQGEPESQVSLAGFEDLFQGVRGIGVGHIDLNGERVSYMKLSGNSGYAINQIGDFVCPPPGDADKMVLIICADYFSRSTLLRLEADYILFYPAEPEPLVQR